MEPHDYGASADSSLGRPAGDGSTADIEAIYDMLGLDDVAAEIEHDTNLAMPQPKRRGRPKKTPKQDTTLAVTPHAVAREIKERDAKVSDQDREIEESIELLLRHMGHMSCFGMEGLRIHSLAETISRGKDGYNGASHLGQALLLAAQKACSDKSAVDVDYTCLEREHLTNPNYHVASIAVKSQQLQIHKDAYQTKLWRLVNAHWQYSLTKRLLLERHVATLASESLVAYIDYCAYDETPMLMSTKGDNAAPRGQGADAYGELHADVLVEGMAEATRTEGVPFKVLQTKQRFGMVLCSQECLYALSCTFPCPLQLCERTTGEVLQEALLRNSGCSKFASSFGTRVRASTTDRAGSNQRAEQSLIASRSPDWLELHLDCEVHVTATVCKKTFTSLAGAEIGGVLHIALSLRQSGSLLLFRQALQHVIGSSLIIKVGAPSLEAVAYRIACLDLFYPESSAPLWQRVVVQALPNGDWRNKDAVEFYQQPGDGRSKQEISDLLQAALIYTLAGKRPPLYVMHRWTSCDKAVDSLMRLECVHSLLSRSYIVFAQLMAKPSALPVSCASGSSLNFDELLGPDDMLDVTRHDDVQEEEFHTSENFRLPEEQVINSEHARSAAEHSADRRKSLAFIGTDPFGSL
eukprot:6492265-Amphidinium_carterae.2